MCMTREALRIGVDEVLLVLSIYSDLKLRVINSQIFKITKSYFEDIS